MSEDWRVGKTTAQCLEHLYLKDTLSDVTFAFPDKSSGDDPAEDSVDQAGGQNSGVCTDHKTDRKTVPGHKFVLAMKSAVFETMFYGETKVTTEEIRIDDVDEGAFRDLLIFIYTDEVTLDGNNVLQCLQTAKKYCVNALVNRCIDFLESSIDTDNVCTLFHQCFLYGLDDLKERCLKVISDNASTVFVSQDFLTLSETALAALFGVDTLEINEVEIFEAALRWAREKCAKENSSESEPSGRELRDVLGTALFKIRFPLMAVGDYTDKVVPSDILTVEEQLQLYVYMTKKGEKSERTVANFSTASRHTSLLEICMPGTPEHLYVVRIKGCVVSFTLNKPVKIHRLMLESSFRHHVDNMTVELVDTDGSKALTYEVDSLSPGKIIFSTAIRVSAGIQYSIRVKFDKTVSVMSCGTQLKMPFTNNSHGINVSWSSWSSAVKSIFVSKV